jgi:hypothetical protein
MFIDEEGDWQSPYILDYNEKPMVFYVTKKETRGSCMFI